MADTETKDAGLLDTPDAIKSKRNQLVGKFNDFKDQAQARKALLEDSKEFQVFKRDADELKAWLQEKLDSLSDDVGSDNVEGKSQKAEALEAEKAATEKSLEDLNKSGNEMANRGHFAADAIGVILNDLNDLMAALNGKLKDRKEKLSNAKDLSEFFRLCDETQVWIVDKQQFIKNLITDVTSNIDHVAILERKFEDFQKDKNAFEPQLQEVDEKRQLLEKHPDYESVKKRHEEVLQQWDLLKALCDEAEEKIFGAKEIQNFLKDAVDLNEFINEKRSQVSIDDFGRDLASAQALQRRHENVERDLQALSENVKTIGERADTLADRYPDHASEITLKKDTLMENWNRLQMQANERRNKLNAAHDMFLFVGEHNDLLEWIKEKTRLITSDELASDVIGAEALITRHHEHKAELTAEEDSFRRCEDLGNRLIDAEHPNSDEIRAKLAQLSTEKAALFALWEERKIKYDQCIEYQLFCRDVEQTEAWLTKQEAFLSNEDLGDSVDSVESLLKKHEDFEKSLSAHEEKVNTMEKYAEKLTENPHYATDDINKRKDSLISRRDALHVRTRERRQMLELSHKFQQFERDAYEIRTWITERYKSVRDENYRDPTNLQGKLQKHQAFQAEIESNRPRIDQVMSNGQEMVIEDHFQSEAIQTTMDDLKKEFEQLQFETKDKEKKIHAAIDAQGYYRNVEDIELWMSEIEAHLASDDYGKDLASCHNLLKKHQLLEVDVQQHRDRVDGIYRQCKQFVNDDHFDKDNIKRKQEELQRRYVDLREPMKKRQSKLDDAMRLHQLFRDIEDEESWIREKEPVATSLARGKDLIGAQKLLKKHNGLLSEIGGHEPQLEQVKEKAAAMMQEDHFASDEIQAKLDDLVRNWEKLKVRSDHRLEDLQDSLEAQGYLLDANESDAWMSEKYPLVASTDYGKNEDAVNSSMKKHNGLMKDIESYRSVIDELARKAQECKAPDKEVTDTVDQECATVLYDYIEKNPRELSVKKGETVTVLSTPTKDWYKVENSEGKQGFVPATYLRQLEPTLKSSQEKLAEEARCVSERQKQIEKQYEDLLSAALKRDEALKRRVSMYGLMRNTQNVNNWINRKNHDKLLNQVDGILEESDQEIEKLDKLQNNFSSLQNNLASNQKKLDEMKKAFEDLKADDEEEFPEDLCIEDDIQQVESTMLQLSRKVDDKTKKLGSAHEVKRYLRECDELLEWMNDKDKGLNPEQLGSDLPSVQALLRKHDAFRKDLDPVAEKDANLHERHLALMTSHPDSMEEIKAKQEQVDAAWKALKEKADEHQEELVKCYDFQKYQAQFRDTMAWVNGMKALAGTDELGKDVNGSEALIERHQDLKNEMDAKIPQIGNFYKMGDGLIDESHPNFKEIEQMKADVKSGLEHLDEVYEEREVKLEENKSHNQFLRDYNQNTAWMDQRESTLDNDNIDDVDSLMKKHEDLDKIINHQEEKILALQRMAEELGPNNYAAPDIEAKKAALITRWEELKDLMIRKRAQLGESQTIQELTRDTDDIESYIQEKLVVALQDDTNDGRNIPSKHQKQLAFEAELAANAERIHATLSVGKALLESKKCQGQEDAVAARLKKITEQYEFLVQKTTEKTARLKEANRQRLYYTAYKDFDFWLNEVESYLKIEEKSNDLTTVQNQRKKHQLLEDDVQAHSDRLVQLNSLAEECMSSPQFDPVEIEQKRTNINSRFEVVDDLTKRRRQKLEEAYTYHQLLRDISEEETWIREKKILVQSTDYGRDLTGVHNLMKKHRRIENEIASHEKRLEEVKPIAESIVTNKTMGFETVPGRVEQLDQAWYELIDCSRFRVDKLNDSQRFYEFIRDVEEEESWISEKQTLMRSNDYGDTLASVQGLIKKHHAFDTDVGLHTEKAGLLEQRGNHLIEEGNLQADKVVDKLAHMNQMLTELKDLASIRRERLRENSAHLQFTWKADVVESWINEKNMIAQSAVDDSARDLSAVQDMLHRQETFEAGLSAFQQEGIVPIGKLRDTLINAGHQQKDAIDARYKSLLDRWGSLQDKSRDRRSQLDERLAHFQAVEDKFLQFAKKASSFNSWFENAEEDLSDPVKCNSIDEIKALEHAHNVFVDSLHQAEEDLECLRALDNEIKAGGATVNPYTWFTMQALDETWDNLKKVVAKREVELRDEHTKQIHNDELRQKFAREANAFHDWLSDTRVRVMEETGTLEQQLDSVKKITLEVKSWRNKLKSIETIGSEMGMHIILDNRYTEHSTVGLHQQWDQLEQLCQRMQQNLEQQIQAKETSGVSETQLRDFSLMFRHHDKERTGRLNHADFKKCLRSLGYDLPMFEEGQPDPEFDLILDIVDRSRDGYVTLQEYMQFMISRETENVQGKGEIEEAFRTLSADGKPYITKIEITQSLDKETADFCSSNMKSYVDMNSQEVPGTYDYVEFCNRLFQK